METHNRGNSAPVVKEFQIEGTWAPLLVYEDGGIYLRKKEPTTPVQTLVSGSISSAETRNNSSNNKPLWEIQNNGRNNDRRSVGGSENGKRGLEEYCLPRWSSQGRRSTTVTLGSTSGQCRSSSSSTSSSFPSFSSSGSVLDNNNVSFVSWDSQSDSRGLNRRFTFTRQDTVQEANLGVSGGKMRSGSLHNQNGSLSYVNSPSGQMHVNANGNISTFAPPTPNLRFNSKETMEDNHVRGKLGEQSGIDLNMTPHKKPPRRKRYTPKVVREDKPKPKPTPKPNTPKPMDTKETTPRVRRTYVRMKKTNPPSTSTPPTERTEATIDPKSTETEQPPFRSCRKSLDFDLNEQGTLKPNTPMPMVDSKESPRRIERQYVRKKRMNPPPTAPCDPEPEEPVKSCRKSLNFDLNEQATGPTSPHVPDSGSTDGNLQFVTKLEVSSNEDGSPENVVVVADDRRTTLLGKRASFLGFPDAVFPEICKKKRSEKPQKRSRASIITTPSIRFDNGASKYHYFNRMDVLNTWANIPRFKRRKRSKGVTRVRDLSNLKGISSVLHRKVKLSDNKSFANRGPTKRTSSRSYDANRANKKWDMVVYDFNSRSIIRRKRGPQSSSKKMMLGENNPASEEWKMGVFLEAITELMRLLDINKEGNYNVSCLERTSLVPYNINNNKQGEDSSLVLYRKEGGALVPFEGLFEPIRKRRQRARVELDDETSRVWRLLLENIDNQGIDGTDEEKVKWWENERSVFRGRVDSFIARMRLVQGDRRFTPWKGSVLDSVIGVFLTQNVSDHLSSSAFMELAARFPLKKSDHSESTLSEEATSPLVVEPEVCIPEPEESITCNDEKEGININEEPVRSGSGSVIDCYSFECIQKANNSPTTETEGASVVGDDSRAKDDATSSLQSLVSSQNSVSSPNPGAPPTDPREGAKGPGLMRHYLDCPTSFMSLLKIAEGPLLHEARCGISGQDHPQSTRHAGNDQQDAPPSTSKNWQSNNYVEILEAESRSSDASRKDENSPAEQSYPTEQRGGPRSCAENKSSCYVLEGEKMVMQSQTPSSVVEEQLSSHLPNVSQQEPDVATESTATGFERTTNSGTGPTTLGKFPKRGSRGGKKNMFDWDSLRKDVEANGETRERTANTRDSIDWEAVRLADVGEIADTIKPRGMNNMLSERIKELLDRLVRDHGRVDLEWLRDIPPDKAKEYLLSFRGLGLKSVECVRLLTLHHLAFPVDTNVGRIAVRLGWVPLQPLPESLQLHLLEMYPVLESIQKYLWPRLCKLDQKTLYELHYHMITFGKVFCTKRQPNCNACPLRGECRHFASAFASARLALPGPEERSIVAPNGGIPRYPPPHPHPHVNPLPLPSIYGDNHHQEATSSTCNTNAPIIEFPSTPLPLPLPPTANQSEAKPEEVNKCEPIVEVPASPEPEPEPTLRDIEDAFYEDPDDEIPTIKLNMKEFTQTLESFMQVNRELQESGLSNALVALTPEAASIPTPKLKNISRLRTEHHVYELPDSHALLRNLDRREPDDPCSYLLAIWTPGETANSIKPPERRCAFDDPKALCNEATCSYCSSQRETNSQIVRGTLLIPCRTAMRGSFPLNGTYFQVNEVFADHDSSLKPIEVPRSWLWNLQRRTVYFGTSIPTIFRGLTTEEIQHCFWRGYVCVRGFDRKTRSPRPLMARLHFPASRMPRGVRGGNKGYVDE